MYIIVILFVIILSFILIWMVYDTGNSTTCTIDNQMNPIPELDEDKYSYFIVMRHGCRKSTDTKAPPVSTTERDPLHHVRTLLLNGLTTQNEWRKIKSVDYPYVPSSSATSIEGVKTQSGNNVWMQNNGNDALPLTEGGYHSLKKFITTVKPFLPTTYHDLYCSATQRTVQTASVVYKSLELDKPFKMIDISQHTPRNTINVSLSSSTNYWIDTTTNLLYKGTTLVTGLYTIDISGLYPNSQWVSGKTYFVYKGSPSNPQGQIITSSLYKTCDPIFIGNLADICGNEILNNGLHPSLISSFQPYMYDTGHLLQYPLPMPKLHEQMYRIIKRWFSYHYVHKDGTVCFDLSDKEYGLKGMIEWIIQQYIDNGRWVSSDPTSYNYLSPYEYRILSNFYYSNIYSSGTTLWNDRIIGSIKETDGSGYINKESIAAKLDHWATDSSTTTNSFYICHESIIHALLSKLGLVLSLHNGNLYIYPSSMCVFRKNKQSGKIDGYYLSPNIDGSDKYIDVCILSSPFTASSNLTSLFTMP